MKQNIRRKLYFVLTLMILGITFALGDSKTGNNTAKAYGGISETLGSYETAEGTVYWDFEDGVLTISGKGKISEAYTFWTITYGHYYDLVIEEGITGFEYDRAYSRVFQGDNFLYSVTLPSTMTSIPSSAFEGCSNLTEVSLGENITSIGDSAFEGCKSLKEIDLPVSLEYIGAGAFKDCALIKSVEFPETLDVIGDGAFAGCSKLGSIYIPENVSSIGFEVFAGCSLDHIEVDEKNPIYKDCDSEIIGFSVYKVDSYGGLSDEEYYILAGCNNSIIPEFTKSIADYAFCGCDKIAMVDLPEGLTEIGAHAFSGCSSLTKIEIPETVSIIGNYAFSGCSSMTEFGFPNNINTIPNGILSGCSALSAITVPDTVVSIGSDAFSHTGLQQLIIPDTVSSIGAYAFSGCTSLKTIKFPKNIKELSRGILSGCSALTEINIPETVRDIGDNAFANTNITTAYLPYNLRAISLNLFIGCNCLTTIYMPQNISLISGGMDGETGPSRFLFPSSVKDIYYEGTETQWKSLVRQTGAEEYTVHYNYVYEFMDSVEITNPTSSEFVYGDDISLECIVKMNDRYQLFKDDVSYSWYRVAADGKSRTNLDCHTATLIDQSMPNAGTYTYVCQCSIQGQIIEQSLPITIEKKGLDVRLEGEIVKDYDGTTNVTNSSRATLVLDGLLKKDQSVVSATATFSYVSAEAGDNIKIIANDIQLQGVNASNNYTCASSVSALIGFIVPVKTSGYIYGGGTWDYCNGELVIEGTGYLGSDWDFPKVLCSGVTTLIIGEGIEGIFIPFNGEQYPNLVYLELPDSLRVIEERQFEGLKINDIYLSENIEYIGEAAFIDCKYLTDIQIFTNAISEEDFAKTIPVTSNLQSIRIPSWEKVPERMFSGCFNLKHVIIPEGVKVIEKSAFENSHLVSLELPESIVYIGEFAFDLREIEELVVKNDMIVYRKNEMEEYAKLIDFNISKNLTTIQLPVADTVCSYLFADYKQLEKVIIPDGTKRIEEEAFFGCTNLKEVYIPRTVTYIGECAFENIPKYGDGNDEDKLTIYGSIGSYAEEYANRFDIKFVGYDMVKESIDDNSSWEFENGVLFFYADGVLPTLNVPKEIAEQTAKIIVTEGVTEILGDEDGEIQVYGELEEILLPNSLTTIGYNAFAPCMSVKEITIPENVSTIDEAFDSNANIGLLSINTTEISGVDILNVMPDNIDCVRLPVTEEIPDYAYERCWNLKNVIVPDGVERIGELAFGQCLNLETVELPQSIQYIDGSAFNGDNITILGDYESYAEKYAHELVCAFIGNDAIKCEPIAPNITAELSDGVLRIKGQGELSYFDARAMTRCAKEIIFDDGVTVSAWFWLRCDDSVMPMLQKIKIPYGIRILQGINNSNVKEVILPDSVTEIGGFAFRECTSLMSVSIPDSVTKIGDSAFSGCASLMSVSIPDSVTEIGGFAFDGCSNLKRIDLPQDVRTIGPNAFPCGEQTVDVYYPKSYEVWKQILVGVLPKNVVLHLGECPFEISLCGKETVIYGDNFEIQAKVPREVYPNIQYSWYIEYDNETREEITTQYYEEIISTINAPLDKLPVGTYKVGCVATCDSLEAENEFEFKVEPKLLDVYLGTVNKEYDGTKDITDDIAPKIYLAGLVKWDEEISVTADFIFEDEEVGNGKNVIASNFKLIGDTASNYTVPSEVILPVGNITAPVVEDPVLTFDVQSSDVEYGSDINMIASVTDAEIDTTEVSYLWYQVDEEDVRELVQEGGNTCVVEAVNIGTYKYICVATYREQTVEENVVVTVLPKELEVKISGAVSKEYDGTTDVPDNTDITFEIIGVFAVDKNQVTAVANFAFENEEVGDNKNVVASNVKLEGDAASNYTVGTVTTEIVGTITEKEVENPDEPDNPVIIKQGWQKENDITVYYVDGVYVVGWQKIDGKWYHFVDSGAMQVDWQKIDNKWYFFDNSGVMQKGWKKYDGKWYYLKDGAMVTGWLKLDDVWYYFSSGGIMQTGWQKINNVWYYFDDGAMVTGWKQINSKWYYFKDGAMVSGWRQISDKWYYFDNGVMSTGWKQINNKWYYFETSGVMAAGKWINDTYYVKSDGTMATSEWVGKYYVDANGKYVPGKTK